MSEQPAEVPEQQYDESAAADQRRSYAPPSAPREFHNESAGRLATSVTPTTDPTAELAADSPELTGDE